MKHKYGLSMTGWLHRAEDLGIVTFGTYDQIRGSFDESGWDDEEPSEDYPTEEPSLVEELFYRAHSEDVIGESKAAELLGLSSDAVYRQRIDSRLKARTSRDG